MLTGEEVARYLSERLPKVAEEVDSRNVAEREFVDGLMRAGAFDTSSLGLRGIYDAARLASSWSPAVAHMIITSASASLKAGSSGGLYSLCVTEPGGGSDVRGNLETVAEESERGALVSGEKSYCSNGLYATHFLVLARGPQGPTLYMVERGSGVDAKALELFAFRGSGVARVTFEGAGASRVGAPGRGIREALEAINYERLGYGAIGLGIFDGALEEAGLKALGRRIFGRALCEYQGVRWMFAELSARARLLESLMLSTISGTEATGTLDPVAAAVAKLSGAELAQRAAWTAMQVMGGSGFSSGSRIERLSRDARVLEVGAGAREVLYDYLGEQVLKRYCEKP